MTQEDKQLLLKDLCARLPYGVKVMKQYKSEIRTLASINVVKLSVYFLENDINSPFGVDIENPIKFFQQIKPYLRPMSSMTEEERKEYNKLRLAGGMAINVADYIDWLNTHHFDYRGLIEKSLALKAPKELYKY